MSIYGVKNNLIERVLCGTTGPHEQRNMSKSLEVIASQQTSSLLCNYIQVTLQSQASPFLRYPFLSTGPLIFHRSFYPFLFLSFHRFPPPPPLHSCILDTGTSPSPRQFTISQAPLGGWFSRSVCGSLIAKRLDIAPLEHSGPSPVLRAAYPVVAYIICMTGLAPVQESDGHCQWQLLEANIFLLFWKIY